MAKKLNMQKKRIVPGEYDDGYAAKLLQMMEQANSPEARAGFMEAFQEFCLMIGLEFWISDKDGNMLLPPIDYKNEQ